MTEFEYEFTSNEDWHGWDFGPAEATVIDLGDARDGIPKWVDSDIYHPWWIDEYECPTSETSEKKKCIGKNNICGVGLRVMVHKGSQRIQISCTV